MIAKPPQQLAIQGKIADVPVVIGILEVLSRLRLCILMSALGDVVDEGTIFTLGMLNIT